MQSKTTLTTSKILQEADWKTIGIQLAAYARWKAEISTGAPDGVETSER